jgi:hypothetical protein
MYTTQLQQVFTLARLVRASSPATKIILGGAAITEAEETIRAEQEAFQWIDAYVFGEGEIPLVQYLDIVRTGSTKSPLSPRLHIAPAQDAFQDVQVAKESPLSATEDSVDFDAIPGPDYQGLNLQDYLAPEIMFPLANHRGCYHRKCEFCSYAIAFMASFRSRSSSKVKADIDQLQEKHGARFFFFADDALAPKRCREIAAWSKQARIPFYWSTEIRQEKVFTAEAFEDLYEGGCRLLAFGNESGNQRVLDLMNKKTEVRENLRIIRDAAAAGIAINLQNFIGFPGETLDEARDTLDMLVANKEYVSSYALGEFSLRKLSPIFQKAPDFGIAAIEPKNTAHLIPSYLFSRDTGIDGAELQALLKSARTTLERSYPCGDVFLDRSVGSHALLYVQYFCERKIEKIFRPEFNPAHLETGRLQLKAGVKSAQIGDGVFLYAPHNAATITFNQSLAPLLTLLQEKASMKELLSRYRENMVLCDNDKPGMKIVAAMEALRMLYEKDFIDVCAAEG